MAHSKVIYTALRQGKGESFNEEVFLDRMRATLSERIVRRMKEIHLRQSQAAHLAGMSAQRFGNYMRGARLPDIGALARIAAVLETSTDNLLGISEDIDIRQVVAYLLEIDGIPAGRASALAEIVQEALRIIAALPPDGDPEMRSKIATQAAWQSASKPV